MIDSFVFLAPILLLPVVMLLAFIGCNAVFGIQPTTLLVRLFRTNCGGPAVADTDLGWADDSDPNAADTPNKGFPLQNTGNAVIDPATGSAAGTIYETCRFGNPGLSYTYMVGQGTYTVLLKFAQISDDPNFAGPFAFKMDGGAPQIIEENNFDVVSLAGNTRTKYDYQENVTVSEAGMLTITFSEAQNHGNFPFIN